MRAVHVSANTVVIEASAAGLSTAHCLEKLGVEHVLLEKQQQVATAWRNHPERLHLHTTKWRSALPDQAWRADVSRYPARVDRTNSSDATALVPTL
jgi:cation diffusion facilitator CzcD-associated flavoprotein CzcO